MCYSLFREVQRTAGVSTTDLVGRMLLMTRQHFRQGPLEYDVGHEGSSQLGLDSDARSPYTGCSQFLPTTQKIIQFSDGKPPKVLHVNTFAASYLNTQGLNNSCLKSRQRRP